MLNNIPTELLLNILSFLATSDGDNLMPLSYASRSLSATTREYRAQLLRTRMANIPHIELLMSIWSPPTFFRRRRGAGQSSGGYAPHPQDLHDILCDPEMYGRIDSYLTSLERKAWIAERLAEHVTSLVSFTAFRTNSERHSYATTIVIELWSAQPRHAHDIDGHLYSDIGDDFILQDVHDRDRYVQSLPDHIQSAMITAYDALAQRLRPPFYSTSRRTHGGRPVEGEGMWLYRLVVKEGMETVLTMLEQKSHR